MWWALNPTGIDIILFEKTEYPLPQASWKIFEEKMENIFSSRIFNSKKGCFEINELQDLILSV